MSADAAPAPAPAPITAPLAEQLHGERLRLIGRLWSLFGGLKGVANLDLGALTSLLSALGSVVTKLGDADSSREYHLLAIDLLRPLAPLTATQLDDGALRLLTALADDAEWHAWVDARLSVNQNIPEGALVLTMVAPSEMPPGTIQRLENLTVDDPLATPFDAAAFTASWVPLVLELIRLLRELRGRS